MRIAVIQESLRSGGAEKMISIIADGLARRGHEIDLLLLNEEGPLKSAFPSNVQVLPLRASSLWRAKLSCLVADPPGIAVLFRRLVLSFDVSPLLSYLPDLARYLSRVQPDALFAAKPWVNIVAVLAHMLSRSTARLVVSERSHLSAANQGERNRRREGTVPLLRRVYRRADAIVAISFGVAEDLVKVTGINADKVGVIYNPAVMPDLVLKAKQSVDHPWLAQKGTPVILSVGRLGAQKDLETLLNAFAKVRLQRPVRLVLVGETRQHGKSHKRERQIRLLAESLGVWDHLSLAGYQPNPYSYMSRADVLVLSSRYEGFGNVLVEALACGCPVVSTDCPSGPSEILAGGEFGKLVPVADAYALSQAILETLSNPPDPNRLTQRARFFSYDDAIDRYEAVLTGVPVERWSRRRVDRRVAA
jgi:glycosyltransferase involved in cell wall biosynthesis